MPARARSILAAALIAAALLPAGARAAEHLVALGDSYSAGQGAGDETGTCGRSPQAFARVIARERPETTATVAACAGADTADVFDTQLAALGRRTRWATLTAGGNDAGFSTVVRTCAKPGWAADCQGALTTARRYVREVLPGRLDALYAAIARRAPGATVIVLSYPRLFEAQDCHPATFFSADEIAALNRAARLLARTIRQRVREAGPRFAFRDAIGQFAGHGACASEPWINGLTSPIERSFHPNRRGQRLGLAALVRSVMG